MSKYTLEELHEAFETDGGLKCIERAVEHYPQNCFLVLFPAVRDPVQLFK